MDKKAVIFAGQGSQYVGMGKKLYGNFPESKAVFDKASEILQFNVKELCFKGPKDELDQTVNTQPAVFTYNLAAYSLFKNIEIDYVAGHSLGEVCACVASDSIGLSEGLRITKERALLMQQSAEKTKGAMIAIIGLDKNTLASLIEHIDNAYISNYNAPLQTTVSGTLQAIREVKESVQGQAKMIVDLPVSGAFHSPIMQEASDKFKSFLESINFKEAHIPIVANSDARIKQEANDIKSAMIRQICAPVQFVKTLNLLREKGVNTFVEIGPSRVIGNLIKRTLPKVNIFSTESVDTLNATLNNL